jgi:DNA-binding CsgD family transcriptional regulator
LSVGIAEVLSTMGDEPRADMVERVRILAARGHDARGLAKAVSGGAPGSDALLVVDDYHHALGSEDAEAFLEELVSLTEFRLLITSRDRPTWLAARKVVYGEAAVVEMDALAFTDEEALAVLGEAAGSEILEEAHGWPAVIGLAAMRGDAVVAASGLRGEELYEFFAEDLFRSAPAQLQEAMFLLALAGVDGARALLGPDAVELVAQAAERGFLAGGARQAVHPLLRGFLLAKLRELDDEARDGLVAAAVEHLAAQHRWDDCLFVLERFPSDELILSTLERGLGEILDSGRVATIKSWSEVAATRRLTHPLLMLAAAEVALRERNDRRAQALGEQAATQLRGELAARSYLAAARAAHLRSSPADARRLSELVLSHQASPAIHVEALWTAFHTAREDPLSDAAEILARLQAVEVQSTSHALRLIATRGIVLCDAGRVSDAISELELAEAVVPDALDPFAKTNALHYLAYAYVIAARYEAALSAATRQIDEARQTGLVFAIDHARLRQIGAYIGLRHFARAARALSDLKRRSADVSSFINDNVSLLEAKLSIATGDLPRAKANLDRTFSDDDRPAFRGELAATRAIVAASLGDLAEVGPKLSEDETCFRFVEAGALREVARAIDGVQRGRPLEEAAHLILGLLELGQADAVVTGMRACPPLARVASLSPDAERAVTTVLVRSRDLAIAKSAGITPPREARPRGHLSPREQDVVELLAQGRTNHEIAQALFISESTAKVHVRHIYEKLGVRSRAEAARLYISQAD